MKSTLSASHLMRHFLLFVMTSIFLLTMMRATYALWIFPQLEQTGEFIAFFVQGLRFDLALVGMICLVPLIVGSLLSMFNATRSLASFIINLFLFGGLFLVLLLELLTPWFVQTQGLRPDPSMLAAVDAPLDTAKTVLTEHAIPAVVALVLSALIMFAFWSRLEVRRFLRFRLSVPSAFISALVGGALCVLAIWSTPVPDVRFEALSPADAQISEDATVNDLTMNTAGKFAYSLLEPYLP